MVYMSEYTKTEAVSHGTGHVTIKQLFKKKKKKKKV